VPTNRASHVDIIQNVDYTTDSIANALAIIDTYHVLSPKALSSVRNSAAALLLEITSFWRFGKSKLVKQPEILMLTVSKLPYYNKRICSSTP
jgi:hypothetical protein